MLYDMNHPEASRLIVLLDDSYCRFVIAADTDAGWIEEYTLDENGKPKVEQNKDFPFEWRLAPTVRSRGRVRVFRKGTYEELP